MRDVHNCIALNMELAVMARTGHPQVACKSRLDCRCEAFMQGYILPQPPPVKVQEGESILRCKLECSYPVESHYPRLPRTSAPRPMPKPTSLEIKWHLAHGNGQFVLYWLKIRDTCSKIQSQIKKKKAEYFTSFIIIYNTPKLWRGTCFINRALSLEYRLN